MKAHQLWFTGPQQVEIREQQLPPLQPGQYASKRTVPPSVPVLKCWFTGDNCPPT